MDYIVSMENYVGFTFKCFFKFLFIFISFCRFYCNDKRPSFLLIYQSKAALIKSFEGSYVFLLLSRAYVLYNFSKSHIISNVLGWLKSIEIEN